MNNENDMQVFQEIWKLCDGDLSRFRPAAEERDEVIAAIRRCRSLSRLQAYLVEVLTGIESRKRGGPKG